MWDDCGSEGLSAVVIGDGESIVPRNFALVFGCSGLIPGSEALFFLMGMLIDGDCDCDGC